MRNGRTRLTQLEASTLSMALNSRVNTAGEACFGHFDIPVHYAWATIKRFPVRGTWEFSALIGRIRALIEGELLEIEAAWRLESEIK